MHLTEWRGLDKFKYYSIDSLCPIESVNLCLPSESSQFMYKIARGWLVICLFSYQKNCSLVVNFTMKL